MYRYFGVSHYFGALVITALLPLLFACFSGSQAETPENIKPAPVYIIKSAFSEPFWFELSSKGPLLIPAPGEASLSPFVPWTHGRHISGFLPLRTFPAESVSSSEEILYAAVNRGGILELQSLGGETAIYYHPGGTVWENYPLAAFFSYNQQPAAFFARERFFSLEEQDAPDSVLWILNNGFLQKAISAPDWETVSLFYGKDQLWYFRKSPKNTNNETAYFRTADFLQTGESITAAAYLEASLPIDVNAPSVSPLLNWVINEASRLLGQPCIAAVVSPEFPAKRLFGNSPAAAGENNAVFPLEIFGYYRPPITEQEELACILFPDGRGVYARSVKNSDTGTIIKNGHFKLPVLASGDSETFVYTGIALLEKNSTVCLIASWEEQENWNVGAAGFLLLEIGW